MAFDPLSLGITGGLMGVSALARLIAQGAESQRPENRLTSQQYVDREAGQSMRDVAKGGRESARVASLGANAAANQRGGYLNLPAMPGGLVDPDMLRNMRRRTQQGVKADQFALAQGARGKQAKLQRASQERVAGAGSIVDSLTGAFMPEIDTGTKALGKINFGKVFSPALGAGFNQAALGQMRNPRVESPIRLPASGLYDDPYNTGY